MTPQELQAALTTARLRVNDWHACASADELARWRADQASLIVAAKASVYPEVEALSAKLQEVQEELASNRACNLFTWKQRAEEAEAKLQEVQAERDYLRDVVAKQANRITEIQSASRGEVVTIPDHADETTVRQRLKAWQDTVNAERGEVVKPAALTTEQFRAEVKDKLSVVFDGCNSTPLQRAINRKQCEDFLVESYAEVFLERGEVVKACPHCNQFYALESTAGNYVCHRCYRTFAEPALWQRVTPSCQ